MKLINIIPIALILTSFGASSITFDGSLSDWGKLSLNQSTESLALKNEERNIIFSFRQKESVKFIPIITDGITTFIPVRNPVIVWIDADNDTSTQIYENHFSKGAEVIFSNVNDRKGQIFYNGRRYKNGEGGVKIASNSDYTVYEVLIPKSLINRHINLLDKPRLWFTYESKENGKASPIKSKYSHQVRSFSANFNPVVETYDSSRNPTSYSSIPGNMFGMTPSEISDYAALAKAAEKVESADRAIDGGGVIGVSLGGEAIVGGAGLGVYEDKNGYGLYAEFEGGPSGLNLQVDGFYAPNATIEDVEGVSVNVKTAGQVPGRVDISTGIPIRNDGLLGRGSTINGELTVLGTDINVPNMTTVTYLSAKQLVAKTEDSSNTATSSGGSNNGDSGSDRRDSGSDNGSGHNGGAYHGHGGDADGSNTGYGR
ncbi:conserved exported hypothetical protein [Vibrio nigripulchritudo SO65]|uniref:hypothetical protein n=1 Tax=Vibrio nigripulchritudo TaxID=28173 RepID=UPI0003B2110E|nr:hypothetical protein [Vibrio nigripulchritudo]CCN38463.1 conserved exported hypothetical protein [Vibrio nigripulchritudo AM115]CCN44247.1 conserved exported hypothetical protein [Vibrio nigripulchritudo FTn2]CCN67731.1 conserved exported hypothetical protein [Vibrio nigripulchritudo POn4]CCN76018.1 conserved exported hypothetical protein [Vibrio nigripulchritudo SO65]